MPAPVLAGWEPRCCREIAAVRHPSLPLEEVARRLRLSSPPVFSRIQGGHVLLDMRTVLGGHKYIAPEASAHLVEGYLHPTATSGNSGATSP